MATQIILAARAYLADLDQGTVLNPDIDHAVLRDELEILASTPEDNIDRAERGRLTVELNGYKDDVETMASDVIGDVMHWVRRQEGDGSAIHAHFRGAHYYESEVS